ncbi:hypothetical protein N9R95_01210 [Flavobacteriaceae bacterium]|nr:hypothetical protein [Flavobacteriaceae bacterium]
MDEINKKSPFKVPDGYFDHFDDRVVQKVNSINPQDGFMIPDNYFEKVEGIILSKTDYPQLNTPVFSRFLWKAMTLVAVLTLFFLNENTIDDQSELDTFFIEDYLTSSNTYEIAEHSDYFFETSNFIDSYETIAIDDALEIRLYGETPTNLNLFDNE